MNTARIWANAIAAGARGLTGASVRWLNCQPEPRQRVYFANHSSHLDFVVLWSVLPKELRPLVRPVAAKDYWSSGIRKRLAVKVFNAVLVERQPQAQDAAHDHRMDSARHSLETLLEGLGQINSLIVFPEGTRGTGETVGVFKSGIYHLWRQRPDVQFVPVYLANLNRVLPKGEVLPVPVISRVIFGAPLQPASDETKESFLTKAHKAIEELSAL